MQRIRMPLVMVMVALSSTPCSAQVQEAAQEMRRFHVLVPDFFAEGGADRDFGKDAAKDLRALLNTLLTHRALERDDIEDALDGLDLDMRDLDCVATRQLAILMDAPVALCASYVEEAGGQFSVTAVFWDVQSAEAFEVAPAAGREGQEEVVAHHIFQEFDRYTAHLRAAANCEAYSGSQVWDRALESCDAALRLNPEAVGVQYRRARVLFETDRGAEALQELERLLERNPLHEAALQLAGYVSGTLGRSADAHAYYSRYLELSPGDASVRMRVAYELAQAGDPRGAMLLIREGLDLDGGNVDLWQQLGGYGFSIGESVYRDGRRGGRIGDDGPPAPDAVRYYREALDAYERVFAERGTTTSATILRQMAVAHLRLQEFGDAAAWAQRGVELYPDDPRLWSANADALRRMGRLEPALEALARVRELDPDDATVGLRGAGWLLEAGRIREAVEALRGVAATNPERADEAARLVLADAYANGIQENRYDYAIDALGAVRTLPGLSEETGHALSFWLGYAILRGAAVEQEPRNLESARATLPKFQRALALLSDVGGYPAEVRVNIEELRSNVRTYIEIQEAIISRGG